MKKLTLTLSIFWIFGSYPCLTWGGYIFAQENAQITDERFPNWVRLEKVRAGYLYVEEDIKYIPKIQNSGFNTIIAKSFLHRKEEFLKATGNIRKWAQACKAANLHLFVGFNWQPDPETWFYRPVVYNDGTKGIAPCPRDADYWQNYLIHLGVFVAQLSNEEENNIDGIFLDCELYGSEIKDGKRHYRENTCYCDHCFSTFLLQRGYRGEDLPIVDSSARRRWLQEHELTKPYFEFLGRQVEQLARRFEREIHELNPSLILGMSPTPKTWVLESMARGLSRSDMPYLAFASNIYESGGAMKIPSNIKQSYEDKGINAVFAEGLLLRCYGAEELSMELPAVCQKTDGYWLFNLPMLCGSRSEKDLAKGTAEEYLEQIRIANKNIKLSLAEEHRNAP